MLFKMTITKTAADGSENKIELENGEAIENQSALFEFLRPLIVDAKPEEVEIELTGLRMPASEKPSIPAVKAQTIPVDKVQAGVLKVTPAPEKPKPVVNRPKQDPPEKEAIRKVSDRETGVVQIHCPACGLKTAKHTPVTASYIPCPTCDVKLYLYPLNEVRGEPDALGVSFRANNIFYSAQERWEAKHGK